MTRLFSKTSLVMGFLLLGGCDRERVEIAEEEARAQGQTEAIHDAQVELEGLQGMVHTLEGGSLPAEDDGPPRPEAEATDDFVPGAVYGLHPQMCHNHGGSVETDANGLAYCDLGTTSAVFRCAAGYMVALIDRPRGRKILHQQTGSYEMVEPEVRERGTRYVGEHNVFQDYGDEGHLKTVRWGMGCRRVGP